MAAYLDLMTAYSIETKTEISNRIPMAQSPSVYLVARMNAGDPSIYSGSLSALIRSLLGSFQCYYLLQICIGRRLAHCTPHVPFCMCSEIQLIPSGVF